MSVGAAWNSPTRAVAEQHALDKCQKDGIACNVVGTYNNGCGYITVGKNNRGGVGWGSGPTAQRAYDNCENQGLDCNTHTVGGCIDD